MSRQLKSLEEQFDRGDQDTKRTIGEYVHDNPGRWVSREELVDEVEIDESGVSRHLDHLHDEGYFLSKSPDDQRFVQWNGRGAGGIDYWIRQIIPRQARAAGNEIRPLLTLDSLGGAYLPTFLFGVFVILGFLCGIFAVILSHAPGDTIAGVTMGQVVSLAGLATIFASTVFVFIPVAKLLDMGLQKLIEWLRTTSESDEQDS